MEQLPPAVEKLILQVQRRHSQMINDSVRLWLHKAGEEKALQILTEVEHVEIKTIWNLCGFIVNKVRLSLGCVSPSVPSGMKVSPAGSAACVPWPVTKEESPRLPGPGPAISDGLSDATLLAIDFENGIYNKPGGCKSYGERPNSTLQMPPVSSQGSTGSVGCGDGVVVAAAIPCNFELFRHLERPPMPEPYTCLGTPPSSSHSVEDSSSQKKRPVVAEDGSSGSRNVKAKQEGEGHEQPKLFDFFNQSKLPSPALVPCASRPILSGSVFADARKLDFGGLEPTNPPSDHSSEVIDPKSEGSGGHPKECKFRFKGCALLGSEFPTADPDWIRAFGELSFTKRFLILDHCKEPEGFPSVEELMAFKNMEVDVVDNRLFHRANRASHIAMRDWSKLKEGQLVFTCNVRLSGKCEFSGPRFENGSIPLQRAFRPENVLRVNFEDTAHKNHMILDRYRCLGIHGIHCGLKKFVFYAYKDADSKRKQAVSKKSTYGCRSVFLAIDSLASADTKDIFKRFRSIAEARSYIMHPTVPSFAKAISRLQLALSQTTQIPLDFDKVHVEYIDDIPCQDENGNEMKDSNNKPLIHTDGCGYISKNLAAIIQGIVIKGVKQQEKTDLRNKQEYPLMMQVRGFHQGNVWKGVHVVNLKIPDNTIQVRRSMLKVKRDDRLPSATFNSLELCNTSRRPSDAKLFQHLILLLKLGGVKDEVFLSYVEAAVDKLKEYFATPCEALRVAVKNMDSHSHALLAVEMLMAGLKPGKEPFLQKILLEMVKSKLQGYPLGKVQVPNTAYLMGCADPTGLLERNQVAILFGNGLRICRDKVLVYKPPGLHQGDVHIFEATWNKEIEAVVGVGTYGIMFSTKGARSITDEMAGSDLDGDQYWVSWNPELVDNFTPSDPWEAPNIKDEEPLPRPTDADEFESLHFNKFIQARFDPSKIKGMSANTWLTLTDYTMSRNVPERDQILLNERIPAIVNLFYESLDADKSGKEVKWCKELQCRIYPHFLEKNKDDANHDPSRQKWNGSSTKKLLTKKYEEYESNSILGRIYDLVKKENFDTLLEVHVDKQFECEGWKEYNQCWSEHFINYKKGMQIEIQRSEEQEFKTCASENIFAHYKMFAYISIYLNFIKLVIKKGCPLKIQASLWMNEKVYGQNTGLKHSVHHLDMSVGTLTIFVGEGKSEEQRFKEASAIYAVVYEDSKSKELNRQTLQFAWKVAGSELCSIYSKKTREGSMCLARENLGFFLRQ